MHLGEFSSFNVLLPCVIPEVNRCVCYMPVFVWVTQNNQLPKLTGKCFKL